MKRAIPILLGLGILVAFGWTLLFLYNKSQDKPVVFEVAGVVRADIVKKTVATGAIVPREEIEIKPRVSGVVRKLLVEPGAYVKRGDLLGEIQIIPNSVALNRAKSSLQQARISLQNASRELARNKSLLAKGVISEAELNRFQLDFELRKQETSSAAANLQLVKDGATRGEGSANTQVRSTVEGMVLAVPVKLGESVIESNTFNAGTTIATIADMTDMIFEGKIDESEVGKIANGMELSIKIGALEKRTFKGKLEYISPKGVLEDGAIQFEIKASISIDESSKGNVFIRAGYSANADIVLARRQQVLALNESLLQFDRPSGSRGGGMAKEAPNPFVEVETGPQQFERREIEVGISDGIKIEIVSGLDENTRIKKPVH